MVEIGVMVFQMLQLNDFYAIIPYVDANLSPSILTTDEKPNIIKTSPLSGLILLDRLASVTVAPEAGFYFIPKDRRQ